MRLKYYRVFLPLKGFKSNKPNNIENRNFLKIFFLFVVETIYYLRYVNKNELNYFFLPQFYNFLGKSVF